MQPVKASGQVQPAAHTEWPLSKQDPALLHIKKRTAVVWIQLQTLKSINKGMLAKYILVSFYKYFGEIILILAQLPALEEQQSLPASSCSQASTSESAQSCSVLLCFTLDFWKEDCPTILNCQNEVHLSDVLPSTLCKNWAYKNIL